ncbi:MAG: filamentous hemagglutinin N-terminal domain-containing protein, partial [Pleurocapsa sp. MO_226.B13]|nr:filamentous hemagglutinin N-terminal domain-containing protein [Pleurocapsa sp. MO_226.B13]
MNQPSIKFLSQIYCQKSLWFLLALLGIIVPQSSSAEPVADTTTGTNVTQNGNQFDIDGGTRAGDNLFHSFEKFGLTREQTANFLSNPDIANILGRVTGGDASFIDGLIQVTGGNSNLYLINPAGIVFGNNASLNLPASFTATTADGIQIGDFWFNALGDNTYENLFGDPSGFAFATDQAGTIINSGNLAVNTAETISLVGGLVINTGTIEAPEGNVNITAVPEKQLVTITPEGSLLSLALPVDAEGQLSANSAFITPADLPTLLTGGEEVSATEVEIAEDGSIRLTDSDTTIAAEPGTIANSGEIIAA